MTTPIPERRTPKKILFYLTSHYPYGNAEPFVYEELEHLSQRYEEIILFCNPKQTQEKRVLPPNVSLQIIHGLPPAKTSLSQYFLLMSIFLGELFFSRQRRLFLKSWKYYFSYLRNANHEANQIWKKIKHYSQAEACYYSYWFADRNLSLSLLKRQGRLPNIYTRAHGFDVYEYTTQPNYLPFRRFCMKQTDGIFTVSAVGAAYIGERYPAEAAKVKVRYLGTPDHGPQQGQAGEQFHLLSCSKIIPLKRLDLIVEALRKVKRPVIWTHIGDGPQRVSIEQAIRSLPSHIRVELKGQMHPSEIARYYKTNYADAFINVSGSEGLPVSIMEAISFGIPVMATDVGGSREIAVPETGILLAANVTPEEIANWIDGPQFRNMDRDKVRRFWDQHFNAAHNYSTFLSEEDLCRSNTH